MFRSKFKFPEFSHICQQNQNSLQVGQQNFKEKAHQIITANTHFLLGHSIMLCRSS